MGSLRIFAILISSAAALFGQAVTGSIAGTIADPTGARVPGAKVRVVNSGTGEIHSGAANEQGDYLFPVLPIGQYEV